MKKIILGMAIATLFLAACNGHATLTVGGDSTAIKTEHNRVTALNAVQSFGNKKPDSIFAHCAADFTDYQSGEDKPTKNIDSIKAGMKQFYAAFPDLKLTNITAFAHGDSALVLCTMAGTFKNDFMGMKSTGKSFKFDDVDVFTFNKDGKVITHASVQRSATMMAQLGIKMPPPPPAPPAKK